MSRDQPYSRKDHHHPATPQHSRYHLHDVLPCKMSMIFQIIPNCNSERHAIRRIFDRLISAIREYLHLVKFWAGASPYPSYRIRIIWCSGDDRRAHEQRGDDPPVEHDVRLICVLCSKIVSKVHNLLINILAGISSFCMSDVWAFRYFPMIFPF